MPEKNNIDIKNPEISFIGDPSSKPFRNYCQNLRVERPMRNKEGRWYFKTHLYFVKTIQTNVNIV